MFDFIKNWFKKQNEKRKARKQEFIHRIACDLFQVKEHDGCVWLTYNGCLVCPAYMLKDDPIASVCVMRKMFEERKNKGKTTNGTI